MSSRGTIFITKDHEHCYDETSEETNGEFNVYIQFDPKNIVFKHDDEECLMVGLRGDSEIAKLLKSLYRERV